MPVASDLLAFQNEVAQLNKMDRTELVKLGYAYADERCEKFFIDLQVARNRNAYQASELAAFSAFATPGMTLLHAGAKAVGIVGGLFAFGTATYLNYGQIMLLLQYNAELQDLVGGAMITYKQQLNRQINSSISLYDAYSIIAGYAWLCTLPGIDSLAHSALSTGAKTTAAVKPSTSFSLPSALAPGPPAAAASGASDALPPRAGGSPSIVIPQIRVVR
jgi:hypothetical protein